MSFTDPQLAALAAPLCRDHVKGRNQAGREVNYIEGWHAIAEANRIFGFDAWDRETVDLKCVSEKACEIGLQKKPGFRVAYTCRVRITVHVGERKIVREGCGYGSGIDGDVGEAHESAVKEAETDAMKRCLITFGNPFGLALYDKTRAEVAPASNPTNAATLGSPARSEPAPQPRPRANHPRRQEALDAFGRIKQAVEGARMVRILDEIASVNSHDLALIKEVHAESYQLLMSMMSARRNEFLAAA